MINGCVNTVMKKKDIKIMQNNKFLDFDPINTFFFSRVTLTHA